MDRKAHISTSSDVHNLERDVLLATKFAIPKIRSVLLPRSHLVSRLEEATTRELVLISTPAGFGKTTLLANWAMHTDKTVAWLSVDKDDNDSARFWRYVFAAVDRVRSGIDKSRLSLFNAAAQPTSKAVITLFVNELAAQPDEFVLVLDDYQRIEASVVHEDLAFLLEQLPPSLHLVISTRSDPPISVARFRARGQLAELRAVDLRFSFNESTALLRKLWELNLPEKSVAVLEERTEGWATGLQLAALALRGTSNVEQFIQEFSGSHRYILDYLTEEVLERQPDEVRSFLLKTSVLNQLCGPLCDFLIGRSNSQQMLEDLERSNLFLMPLDEERRWYRYHHLFADLLLSRLQSMEPEQVPELHRNAAAWYERHGLISDALQHALAASEAEWAARLVEQHVEEVLRHGEGETLRRWLAALPEGVVRSRPRLALAQAISALNAGSIQIAEPLLDDAERGLAIASSESYEPSIGKEFSMLANVPASIALLRASIVELRGDAERATELVRQAQAHLAMDERGPRISARWNLAQADWLRGRLAEAESAFVDIVMEGYESREPHLALTAGFALGRIQQAQGRLTAAYRTYQEGLRFAAKTRSKVVLSAAVTHFGIAQVLYEQNQLKQALDHIMEGISLSRQLVSTQSLATGLITLAWIQQAMGNLVAAQEAMEEANQLSQSLDIVSLHNPAPAERARLWIAEGDIQKPVHWVEQRGLDADDKPGYARELEYLVLARILLRRNLVDQALTLLEHLERAAQAQGRVESLIKIQSLQALGFQAAGKTEQAMGVLSQALMRAEPEGYIRIFVDEGPHMAALLHKAAVRKLTPEYVARLLATFPSIDQGIQLSSSSAAFPLSGPLSERELEVLQLLASGTSNESIAKTLSIALTTSKKHVSNIIRKLGVNNRTQAVSRGRDLGLL